MLRNKTLLVMCALIGVCQMFTSCSGDDPEPEPTPIEKPDPVKPEEPKTPEGLSAEAKEFIENYSTSRRIVLPGPMMEADIENDEDLTEFFAAYATEWALVFNAFPDTIFARFGKLPGEDAIHTTAVVGGTAAPLGAEVYTWKDVSFGGVDINIVYQLIEQSESNLFQLFLQRGGDSGGLVKIMEAVEAKDFSKAHYKYFFAQELADDEDDDEVYDDGELVAEYVWEGDILKATMSIIEPGYMDGPQDDDTGLLTLNYDRKTKSGDILYHDNRVDIDSIVSEWDTDGNGELTLILIELNYDDDVVTDWVVSEPATFTWF